ITRKLVLTAGVLLVAACGHGGTGAPQPAPIGSAEGAVREFLAAVSDSNITRMSTVWGNTNGPASVTGQPPQWEERLKIVQIYLRGGTWTVLENKAEPGSTIRRDIAMQFTRGSCVKTVPFVAVKSTHGGWLVESVDVTATGNPVTPCPAVGSGAPAANP
ncbi:MAG TPA: hypothetical protein VFI13_13970, partial [Gemmatimonadales bacterium]|nr:hypothetical protein [Gemmatimonadales bacterium]